MHDDTLIKIIDLARETDLVAAKTYFNLAGQFQKTDLGDFWRGMAEEEQKHARLWLHLRQLAQDGMIPQLFDAPEEVFREMQQNFESASNLHEVCCRGVSMSQAFFHAYTVEYHMLHFAFAFLFSFSDSLENLPDGLIAHKDYEQHIRDFVEATERYGVMSPELRLIGDALLRLLETNRRLWRSRNNG
ncbi:MAG: hypothetical protein AB7E32_10205 [Desulfovibrio sp.]